MNRLAFFIALALASTIAAPSPAPDVPEAALARAREAADALGQELMATLLREMARGGPPAAVRVCSERAREITDSHSTDGLTVRRVTLKPRSSRAVPDAHERRKLEELEEARREGDLPAEDFEVVSDPRRRLRYLRPITIRAACLNCHGGPDTIPPEVQDLLRARYPDDRAVGYREGDLRGAISVVVDLGETPGEDP